VEKKKKRRSYLRKPTTSGRKNHRKGAMAKDEGKQNRRREKREKRRSCSYYFDGEKSERGFVAILRAEENQPSGRKRGEVIPPRGERGTNYDRVSRGKKCDEERGKRRG